MFVFVVWLTKYDDTLSNERDANEIEGGARPACILDLFPSLYATTKRSMKSS